MDALELTLRWVVMDDCRWGVVAFVVVRIRDAEGGVSGVFFFGGILVAYTYAAKLQSNQRTLLSSPVFSDSHQQSRASLETLV
jgi:hypothetical protein